MCSKIPYRRVRHGPGPAFWLWSCLAGVLLLGQTSGRADILHLAGGGTVEGEILETTEQFHKIRTGYGVITLPADTVKTIEKTPSPFEEYDRRSKQAGQDAGEHVKLAEWCEQHGLPNERRKHLLRAVELDGNCAPAHEALGHVRVGFLWVDGRTGETPKNGRRAANADKAGTGDKNAEKRDAKRDAEPPDRNDAKVVATIQGEWTRRIRAVKSSLLDSALDRLVQNGRTKILEIKDPLAILPLARELGRGGRLCRALLIEALAGFREDEATLNLAVIALIEPEEALRAEALSHLVRRNDPRVISQFRTALASNNDFIVRRAATGLGTLKAREAVPDLIDALTARRRKLVEIPVRRYIQEMPTSFQESRIPLSPNTTIIYTPQVGFLHDAAGTSTLETEHRLEEVTVYRTEVLESLKLITGRNFGFESDEWRRWHQEQPQ